MTYGVSLAALEVDVEVIPNCIAFTTRMLKDNRNQGTLIEVEESSVQLASSLRLLKEVKYSFS
jgi:hypothetical protein